MKLKDITQKINAYDCAVGAASYGNSPHNIARVIDLLDMTKKIELAKLVSQMALDDLNKARTELESLGIEIDKDI